MAAVLGLQCIRCDARYPADHYAHDCSACRPVARSNLTVVYDESLRRHRSKPTSGSGNGLWRYGDLLPVAEIDGVSLGEGGSRLHRLSHSAERVGIRNLFAKDETRNPTWSFKDRLACMAVSAAKKAGAKVIVSSSSGNAGAAAAAYAAKAGMPCVVFTFKGTAGPMLTQMRGYGAKVVAVEEKPDRWRFMEHTVREFGWFPTSPFFGPVVGSNPFGIEGYKTLAYEVVEQLGWQVPDWCILPVCYGDALLGMWRGFEDMMAFGWTDKMPRMVAAEVYGSVGEALSNGTDTPPDMPKAFDTVAVSIGATQGTYQALDIVRRSKGVAVKVGNDDMMRWQQILASSEGLYVEPASAAGLVAVEQLASTGRLAAADTVVSLLTASGLKDPAATAKLQGELLTVPSDFDKAAGILRASGIFPSDR
ncbi:threonine synthase [Afipia massiliensis]|uniref:Threonine synthase n=1 Tax=Afipia massiliensis TaxID=211460 RepID=A0A840N441_9BRAD|nr:pyridoxal-phosphate dependent enzyme [Afipia massiliensis]MBB5055189.1 threonine synthase [Afipia massiliensis]